MTVGVGQCGNQISANFWEKLCQEHGIQGDGSLTDSAQTVVDRKDVFFYQSDDTRYVPRAVLLDLEPRVLNSVEASPFGGMYNPENIFHPSSGSGAGNNWASGYEQGSGHMERILDILEREVENSDSLDAFMLMHSVAGGTGSGMGSVLLEHMRDRFPKTILQTVSVFPTIGESKSDTVVQPYNSILALQRLIQQADSVLVFDNNALNRIASETLMNKHAVDMHQVNSLVSSSLLTATATIRFPGYLYNSWHSILTSVINDPAFHFLTASYTPVLSPYEMESSRFARKTTVTEIMRRLVQLKYVMLGISTNRFKNARYLSLLRVIQGDLDVTDYRKKLQGIYDTEHLNFVPSSINSAQVVIAKRSPFIHHRTKLNGLALANSTAVADCFIRTISQFDPIYSRGAFLSEFRRYEMFQDDTSLLADAAEVTRDLIAQYNVLENEPV